MRCGALFAGLALSSVAGSAQIVVLASADTYITQHPEIPNSPTTNFNSASGLLSIGAYFGDYAYEATPLVRFDLTGYSGRTVTSDGQFSIWLNSGITRDDGAARLLSLHGILVSWNPATVTYSNFGPAYGIQDSDISSALTSTSAIWPDSGARFITFTVPAATLQQWIDAPASNNGLIIRNTYNGGDLGFASLEAGSESAPRLAFNLQAVPEPATVWLMLAGGAIIAVAMARAARGRRGHVRWDGNRE